MSTINDLGREKYFVHEKKIIVHFKFNKSICEFYMILNNEYDIKWF